MAKIGILIADLFEEREFIYPYYRLQEAGHEVVVIGPEVKTFHGKSGFPFKAHLSAAAVKAEDLSGLVIPGGFAPDHMRRSGPMVELVKALNRRNRPIAAICHAGWMLISADIVRGRQVTGYHSIRIDLINAGATFVDDAPVVDGNLVTAREPRDIPVWMAAFLEKLG